MEKIKELLTGTIELLKITAYAVYLLTLNKIKRQTDKKKK